MLFDKDIKEYTGDSWPNYTISPTYMGVSLNGGTPKSSILIGFSYKPSIWGTTILGNPHIDFPEIAGDFPLLNHHFKVQNSCFRSR